MCTLRGVPKRSGRVVGYLRVSTDAQAERGFGLDVQEQAIRQWAKRENKVLTELFPDAGVSGSNGLESRVALPEALSAMKEGGAEGLVVYRLDRLARDLVLQETLLMEIKRLGCYVYSTAGGEAGYLADDPEDPSRRLIRQILGAVSEYERSMINLRLRSGRQRKKERGGYASGSPPFGWEAIDGDLVPVVEQQAVRRRIRALHDDGHSIRQIAENLNRDSVPTKRDGGRWHPTSVARILQSRDGSAPGHSHTSRPRCDREGTRSE
jgi:DNA invertase Pin-like site-specific DNA recombinase